MNKEKRRYIDMSEEEFFELFMGSTPKQRDRIIKQYLDEVEQEYRVQRAKNYDHAFAGPPHGKTFDELTDEYYRLEKQKIWLDLAILWILSVTGIAWLLLHAISNL